MTFPTHIPARELIGESPAPGFREVRLVYISTLTGSASLGGSTGKMGNETDAELFQGVRQWSDAILVGANTVRREGYGAVAEGTEEQKASRRLANQSPAPVLAVISRSLDFPATAGQLALTPQSSLEDPALRGRRDDLESAGVELVSTGGGSAEEIIDALTSRGLHRIDCEGGPGIAALMLDADLIDVVHLTFEPVFTTPVEQPLLSLRPGMEGFQRRFGLEQAAPTADDTVFLRYRRTTTR